MEKKILENWKAIEELEEKVRDNGSVLCDVAVSKHYTFNLQKMFNQSTNAAFCTSPAILQNTCYLPFS